MQQLLLWLRSGVCYALGVLREYYLLYLGRPRFLALILWRRRADGAIEVFCSTEDPWFVLPAAELKIMHEGYSKREALGQLLERCGVPASTRLKYAGASILVERWGAHHRIAVFQVAHLPITAGLKGGRWQPLRDLPHDGANPDMRQFVSEVPVGSAWPPEAFVR